MQTLESEPLSIQVSDVSGQNIVTADDLDPDTTVGELTEMARQSMNLPRTTRRGEPLTYHARLDREGRHLHASERVGDALRQNDRLLLQHNIDAGGDLGR